jgi:osmotically-inducible protein OsmY
MWLSSRPRQYLVAVGIAAAILGASALSGRAYAQDSYAQDSSASSGDQRTTAGADVATRVKAALNADATLDSRHIDVSMEKGNVVLTGFVQSANGVTDATRIAMKAAGTHKIINKLTVQQGYPNAP